MSVRPLSNQLLRCVSFCDKQIYFLSGGGGRNNESMTRLGLQSSALARAMTPEVTPPLPLLPFPSPSDISTQRNALYFDSLMLTNGPMYKMIRLCGQAT
ncbi:hypothetical protein JTE90_000892 [Oedothorax gibbosus]|uniref:Uncharacterized protein n=1 Tax=Oedothorax gibbosus TaxID=931172 RepID=A0AAV6VSX5_9ARAC|nr:hypothetical protein JTE90_000892 [Oedothorax gibbosus]